MNAMSIAEISGVVAVALVSIAFGLQKILKSWKESSTESSILSIMHQEFERMSAHNTTLVTELNRLQIELVTLNKELYNLSVENQRLHVEVATLTHEINVLKTEIANHKGGSSGPTS